MPDMAISLEKTTRDLILDAMDGLMARYGFRKTTVDDVAREARVSRRTIYLYFSSKEELGLASIERVVLHAQARMEQELAAPDAAEGRGNGGVVTNLKSGPVLTRTYEG